MCSICKSCKPKAECYCPRCPQNPDASWICVICGDTKCVNTECLEQSRNEILKEHFDGTIEFCQSCVETKYDFTMSPQLGMYCDEHEVSHKHRMGESVRCFQEYRERLQEQNRKEEELLEQQRIQECAGGGGYPESEDEEDEEDEDKEVENLKELEAKANYLEESITKMADLSAIELASDMVKRIRKYISSKE